nr:protein PHYLLO, chloroplastic-like isoform X2 [Physcomitrium patens]|eukprot:XP_024385455.1 protein PHYLLO, chloroplastic-like isoform X2 [Physcomitrella patens]
MRFNPQEEPAEEWKPFGSFYFLIPQVEFCECEGCSMLAVSVAWDTALHRSFEAAVKMASETLNQVSCHVGSQNRQQILSVESKEHAPSESLWHQAVCNTLQRIREGEKSEGFSEEEPSDQDDSIVGLSKVVMARRTKLQLSDDVDPLTILALLQAKDPSAYQFSIQLSEGSSFIGSTPERLFARRGLLVASEAVAATRSRGYTSSIDLDTGLDLILSSKDHEEFEIVRESIRQNLEKVCKEVEVESHKSIIKQARVQHLYGRFLGTLHSEVDEFDLIRVLHPTPAVCGHPQAPAREAITASESFDRGMYAGPVGWFGGMGSEFAVGIRSSLIESKSNHTNNGANIVHKGANIFLYAGVGVVKDSDPSSEWQELELKVSQFESLLQPSRALKDVVNINALWAKLIVEECCRLGITYFCIAPGSRSSPLAAAAAANSLVTCTSCIDERSLAFHAVGYGRGANKPAAVITSSGTAVSNLLPAVVEASQDHIPLLLLTADRPHELRDTSANQTIDQVNHFGGFVRYFFDLPPADDKIPARMVLTTLDSAVFRAKTVPSGPVHINCPFREPLAGLTDPWSTACLKGLDRWILSSSPFTTYMNSVNQTGTRDILEIVHEMKGAKRGLLVVGGLHTAEETWAVAMLASHLGWPVFPDVLSGLRIGHVFHSGKANKLSLNIIQHIDQILLKKSVADVIEPDVILQIGGRLTSKRVGTFLGASTPRAYILVEEHPIRADPSHVVTHRVQSNTSALVDSLLKLLPKASQVHGFLHTLQTLSEAIGRDIEFKLSIGTSITEPYVARAVAAATPPGSTLFLGNSMPIRDVEMYATSHMNYNYSSPFVGLVKLTASNRGASGIDGVLSTAIGFGAGSNRRVTLLVGDVSFLHDTNGLTLLKERVGQAPVTVVVVNNEGGGIFSLLPIAKTVPSATFATIWSTEHNVSILNLCRAHRVNHILVRTKRELEDALRWVEESPLNWVVEVESNIERNAEFHRLLQNSVMQAANRAFQVTSLFPSKCREDIGTELNISGVELFRYKIPLSAPPSTSARRGDSESIWRHGFLLCITLHNGVSGVGEVAPLEGLHKESLEDVEEQLQLLLPILKGCTLPPTLALLDGSFKSWLLDAVGIHGNTLFPSVRCGLEMAVLEALAVSVDCSLWELLVGRRQNTGHCDRSKGSIEVKGIVATTKVCGLIDSTDSPNEVADEAGTLVGQGFCTLKLKVGRRATPQQDAAVIQAVRERVGADVKIRADANRKWSYQQAIEFANLVKECDMEYLEEPVEIKDIPRFCKESGIPVALDESVDEDTSTSYEMLERIASDGVVAVVIKPGRVGGFERAVSIAEWAHSRGMVAVISSAFETSIGLTAYAHLAGYVDERWVETRKSNQQKTSQDGAIAHGLGTYTWLGGDIIENGKFEVLRENGTLLVPLLKLSNCRHVGNFNRKFVTSTRVGDIGSSIVKITTGDKIFEFHVWDTQTQIVTAKESSPILLFLHGFLGTGQDWLPIMKALSSSFRCIAVDLPCHGQSEVKNRFGTPGDNNMSMDLVSDALSKLMDKLKITHAVSIGYSMGARIALHLSLYHSNKVSGVVSISGSPGLEDEKLRKTRASKDALLAQTMKELTLETFLDLWYEQPLWESLRQHPSFSKIKRGRMNHKDKDSLAAVLESLSVGLQPSLWEKLCESSSPTLLVTGSLDTKFVNIARKMCERAGQQPPKRRRSQNTSRGQRAQRKDDWESQEYRLPFDFVQEFPEVNMVLPSLDSLPEDEEFAAFFAKEMRKLQLEDTLALEADDWPTLAWEGNDLTERHDVYQVAEVEDCGHAVHVENPFELVRLLRAFLGQLQFSSPS